MVDITPVLTVPPAAPPVSLIEAKTHMRVSGSDEDALISALIDAATGYLDGWAGILGRCIVSQTWRQDLPCFSDEIRLPLPDVQSAVIAYTDLAGATQTVLASNYYVVNRVGGAALVRNSTFSWPATANLPNAVRVSMVCGYATTPPALKSAILLHIGALFTNRESVSASNLMPFAYDALVAPYRRVGFG